VADRKITDLTALTTPASADVLPIVDVSEAAAADKNKKITVGELFKGVPDGSAAAPAIAFETDDGNGLFLSTTDTIGIATNGVSRATVSTTAVTSTLPVIVPDGSAAAPSVAFTGSGTDTGLYSPGADQVAISTSSVGRLFIDASGNVGVGQSGGARGGSGTRFLSKLASGQSFIEVQANGTADANALIFSDGSTGNYGAYGYDHSNDSAYIQTAGQTRLTIDSSGRLGLGTSTPDDILTVSGAPASSANAVTTLIQSGANYRDILRLESSAAANSAWNYLECDSAFVISGEGRVGIGTTSPSSLLAVHQASASTSNYINITNDATGTSSLLNGMLVGVSSSGAALCWQNENLDLLFGTNNTERARIDSSGRLLVGTSTSTKNLRLDQNVAIVKAGSGTYGGASLTNYPGTADDAGPIFDFNRSRGTSDGSMTSVASGDVLGYIQFRGADGTNFIRAAQIHAAVDGTPGANDMPGRLVFSTTADGASSPTERMRINNDGGIVGGGNTSTYNLTTSPGFSLSPGTAAGSFNGLSLNKSASNWGTALYIHRTFGVGDGVLIEFAHDTVTEGTISVSGTTVSYNGGHLSRWSQTINPNEPDTLLKGTVMTNFDEMCEWFKEDGTLEDNEQLNKMAVSSVEGDPNVAGVLVSIDEDGDLNIGMTGDMIIRIAEGVTVQRGDLLMSAGDGTAKPQDDDIVRSKTVAKVTSTHVTCTYDDGSYCVPCVLMAC